MLRSEKISYFLAVVGAFILVVQFDGDLRPSNEGKSLLQVNSFIITNFLNRVLEPSEEQQNTELKSGFPKTQHNNNHIQDKQNKADPIESLYNWKMKFVCSFHQHLSFCKSAQSVKPQSLSKSQETPKITTAITSPPTNPSTTQLVKSVATQSATRTTEVPPSSVPTQTTATSVEPEPIAAESSEKLNNSISTKIPTTTTNTTPKKKRSTSTTKRPKQTPSGSTRKARTTVAATRRTTLRANETTSARPLLNDGFPSNASENSGEENEDNGETLV